MKKNIKSVLLVSAAVLSMFVGVGCSNNSGTQNSSSQEVNTNVVDSSATSVKDAVTKLANSKNYTITVKTKTGPLDIVNNMYYTENAFYDDYLGDEYGYCKVNDGVYKFDRYARKYTPSAILKDKEGKGYDSIWGKGFFYGFSDLDLSEFDTADGKTFECSKKKNKLSFMKMFSIDQSKYPDVNAIKLTVDNDVNTLTFSISIKGGEKHECVVKNFGTTEIDYLNKQLDAGKTYYTADETMKKIVDLFSTYNYTHFMYDTEYDEKNPVGYEKFTEEYFISGFYSEYLKTNPSAMIKCSGMVGFDNYVVNDKVTLNGSYWTYLYDTTFSIITSFFYNEDSYVPNVYVYPTYLTALLDSQYFEQAGKEGSYFTNKISVISDFCTNFQLWEGLQDNNYTPCGLFVTYDKSYKGQDTVTFSIQYDYYGVKGTTDFVFSDFGTTREQVMEQKYVKKYIDVYYNTPASLVSIGDNLIKMSIYSDTSWLLDDDIVAAYSYTSDSYYKYGQEGAVLSFKTNDGTTETVINPTPLDDEKNNNYVEDNGTYKIKETAETAVYLFKYKDGSWKFKVTKA